MRKWVLYLLLLVFALQTVSPSVIAEESACTHERDCKGNTCTKCYEEYSGSNVTHSGEIKTNDAIAATCTEDGSTEGSFWSCCFASITETQVIPALGHVEEVIPGKAGTCVEDGLTEGKKCARCGEILAAQETIPMLGHTEVVISGVPATCTETGLTDGIRCSVCGEEFSAQSVIPALGHVAEVLPGVGATCTENGLTEGVKCSVCGETITAQEETPVNPDAHDWEILSSIEPTCGRDGQTESACRLCGVANMTIIPATGKHNYQEVMLEADCENPAMIGTMCVVCADGKDNLTVVEGSMPLGHKWYEVSNDGKQIVKACENCGAEIIQEVVTCEHAWVVTGYMIAPSCDKEGVANLECKLCGAKSTGVAPASHSWVVTEYLEEPTCGSDGVAKNVCEVCKETKYSVVPATGEHIFASGTVDADCTNPDRVGMVCEVCGAAKDLVEVDGSEPLGHDEGEWVVVENATVDAEGLEERRCTRCGTALEERSIAKIEKDERFEIDENGTITAYYGTDTELVIPETISGIKVTGIGSEAFRDCTGLTSVVIPDGVTWISTFAFCDCINLVNVAIPDSVTRIEANAFSGCSSLISVELPQGLTSIAYCLFENCTSLTSVVIPDSVTAIGSYAFFGCVALKNVVIPGNVTDIGAYAFYECKSLTDITIPEGVTSIEDACFAHCEKLTDVTVPDGVTTIKYAAFRNCSNLKNVEIPNSVTSIESEAFGSCGSLINITIPDGVTLISTGTFSGCTSLNNITIPEGVTHIGTQAFYMCSSLTNIAIPSNVVSIEAAAFRDCSNLESIIIPEGITSISDEVFMDCTNLDNITMPDGVRSIGNYAFYGCTSLGGIEIPNGVTEIGDSAFMGCIGLTSIEIPASVTAINGRAFCDCNNLSSVVLKEGLNSIGEFAFARCKALTNVVIPEGVTVIKNWAFAECSNLLSISLPEGITAIEDSAFCECVSLISVVIPYGVTRIGKQAFMFCNDAVSISVPNSVTDIGNNAFGAVHDYTVKVNCTSYAKDWCESNGVIADVNHTSWIETAEAVDPTCTETGSTAAGSCSDCGRTMEQETIPALGHKIAYEGDAEGHYEYCERCDYRSEGKFNHWRRCIEEVCNNCGEAYNGEDISHWNTSSVTDETYCQVNCNDCGNVVIEKGKHTRRCNEEQCYRCWNTYTGDNVEHTNIGWEIVTEATPEHSGLKEKWCYNCNTKLAEEVLPQIDPRFEINEDGVITKYLGTETELVIPDTINGIKVTGIGYYAFEGCSDLTSVVIPDGVTTLYNAAFDQCSSLSSVVIPESVTVIGEFAFNYCTSLVRITLPNSVTSIGFCAFQGCTNLESVNIPDNATDVNVDAFNQVNDYAIKVNCGSYGEEWSVTYGKNVDVIHTAMTVTAEAVAPTCTTDGLTAAGSCSDCGRTMEQDVIPALGHIIAYEGDVEGHYEFCKRCDYRSEQKRDHWRRCVGEVCYTCGVPYTGENIDHWNTSSVTDEMYCQVNCNDCGSVVIEKDKHIRRCNEEQCYRCWNTYTGDNVEHTNIGWEIVTEATPENPGFKVKWCYACNTKLGEETLPQLDDRFEINSNGVITRYIGTDTELVIPDTINGIQVTEIGEYAFENCTTLASVTIPSGVTSVGYKAFYGCSSLTGITIPDAVTYIGMYAFQDCSSLVNITLPEELITIEYAAFLGCSSLASIQIPERVIKIDGAVFMNCSSLTSVVIPEGVTTIGESAFSGCISLNSIEIPSSVTNINSWTFSGCSGLTRVVIPDSVTSIGESAFRDCTSLTDITIPESITVIESFVFNNCASLTQITIPSSVTTIGEGAFWACSSLTNITIPDSVTVIESYAFSSCTGLTQITIPNSVTTIGDWVFCSCSSLTSVTIPTSVTSIGEVLFNECSNLSNVVLPEGMTAIGSWFFGNCINLTSVTIPSSVTTIGDYAFTGCSSLTEIEIPSGVTSIGEQGFAGCRSLINVTIPEGMTSIGNLAFAWCNGLFSISIPDSVTSIGEGAFNGVNDYVVKVNCTSYAKGWCETNNVKVDVNHTAWTETAEAVDPTCAETGLTAAGSCSDCGLTMVQEVIPALGHPLEWVSDEEGCWLICPVCGYADEKNAHFRYCNKEVCMNCETAYLGENVLHDLQFECDDTWCWGTCINCGYEQGKMAHSRLCDQDVCYMCGLPYTGNNIEHWNTVRVGDESGCWSECTVCGFAYSKSEHDRFCDAEVCNQCGLFYDGSFVLHRNPSYVGNAEGHYLSCSACNIVPELEKHWRYCNAVDEACVMCGAEYTDGEIMHTGGVTHFDETSHWEECACGLILGANEHYRYCDEDQCAWCLTDYAGNKIIHHSVWESDAEGHVESCSSCDYVSEKAEHKRRCNGEFCLDCGARYEGDNIEHGKLDVKAAVEATCTEPGLTEEKKCVLCKEIVAAQEVIPALGHDVKTGKPATCTEDGNGLCIRCGAVVVIPALGHNWITGKPATCTEDGSSVCGVCGEKKIIYSTGHNIDWVYDEVNHWGVCTACGYAIKGEEHRRYCDEDFCFTCGMSYTGEVVYHRYMCWSGDENGHWEDCSGCDYTGELLEHARYCDGESCWLCSVPYDGDNLRHYAEWAGDETHHYMSCTNCDYVSEKSIHGRNCDSEVCWECGLPYTGEVVGHDSLYTTTHYDETGCWFSCSLCGFVSEKDEHLRFCNEERCMRCQIEYTGESIMHLEEIRSDNGHVLGCSSCGYESSSDEHWRLCNEDECADKSCRRPYDGDNITHNWEETPYGDNQILKTCTRCGEEEIVDIGGTDDRLPGDVNGDGVVDTRDLLRLAKFLGNHPVEIVEKNATVNGDDVIDTRDLLRLAKFLGNHPVELQ